MAGGTARGGGSIRSDGGGDGNSGRMSKWVSVAGVLITWSAVLNAWKICASGEPVPRIPATRK